MVAGPTPAVPDEEHLHDLSLYGVERLQLVLCIGLEQPQGALPGTHGPVQTAEEVEHSRERA